jgi:hypothetical protein
VYYEFDVVAGTIDLSIEGVGSTGSGMDGAFGIIVYQSDGHIGESDTFIMESAGLYNSGHIALGIGGLVTAHILPGSAWILDFIQPVPGHIGPGGVGHADVDGVLNVTVFVSGAFVTTFYTHTSIGAAVLPLDMMISTSVTESDIVTASLIFVMPYTVGIPDITMTLTLDLIIDLIGTAHVVPDPALGGLTALGLGGAGAWLRRRRR